MGGCVGCGGKEGGGIMGEDLRMYGMKDSMGDYRLRLGNVMDGGFNRDEKLDLSWEYYGILEEKYGGKLKEKMVGE